MVNCTITNNSYPIAGGLGAGLIVLTGAFTVQNTILADNQINSVDDNCAVVSPSAIVSAGNNLTDTAYADCGFSAYSNDIESTEPNLGALQDNGGPTHTLLPNSGVPSAAIDAGKSSGCPTGDQRGQTRSDGSCDIGAVEIQSGE